jgi:hypothetical protein
VAAPNDKQQLQPLVEQVITNVGVPAGVTADSGYFSEANVQALWSSARGTPIESYIAVDRDRHGAPPLGPPRGRIPAGLTLPERMRRKLRTKRGRAIYAKRKCTVEPVIGQVKGRGFRRLSLRGVGSAKGEFRLVCAVHNLLKLWRAGVAVLLGRALRHGSLMPEGRGHAPPIRRHPRGSAVGSASGFRPARFTPNSPTGS